jgi:hypothetical protein
VRGEFDICQAFGQMVKWSPLECLSWDLDLSAGLDPMLRFFVENLDV